MRTVIAVLDRTSAKSFGMLALIVRDDKGRIRTEGLAQPRDHELSKAAYDELVERKEATVLRDEVELSDSEPNHAALWLGEDFGQISSSLQLVLPPLVALPKQQPLSAGSLWVLHAPHVYHTLEVWLQHAFRRSDQGKDPAVAKLMSWSLPDRIETRAALWKSANKPDLELEWHARLLRDAGVTATEEDLRSQYEHAIHVSSTPSRKKVVGFTGLARCGDKEIAERVAKRKKVAHLSFGRWLAKEARRLGYGQTRPALQDLGQSVLDRRGALSFCLSVIEDSWATQQLAAELVSGSFVLESVRHKAVLDAIHFLVGSDRFELFSAVRSTDERRKLLESEGIIDIDSVMHHPTELEVDSVAKHAKLQLDSAWGPDAEAERVLALV